MPPENDGKRIPVVRQRTYVQGLVLAPSWHIIDLLVGFSDGEDCQGALFLEEEDTTHPDQIPLLALRQIDDDGVLGEVWFEPADLPILIAGLTEQLRLAYSKGTRRWRGKPDGPLLNLGY